MSEEEKDYDIEATIKKVGILYPDIADARGRILDCFNRLKIDPC